MGISEQQNPDGSWSPAIPMGWQGGIDAEVYHDGRGRWRAEMWDEDMLVGSIRARTELTLTWKVGRWMKRFG